MTPSTLITLRPWQRWAVVTAVIAWTGLVMLAALSIGTPVGIISFILYFLKLYLLILPLTVIRNEEQYGLHPLIFIGAWTLITNAIPEASIVLHGLNDHPGMASLSASRVESAINFKFLFDAVALGATYLGFILFNPLPIKLTHPEPTAIATKLLVVAGATLGLLFLMASKMGGIEALALTKGKYVAQAIGGGHWNVMAGIIVSAVWLAAALMHNPWKSFTFWLATVFAVITEFLVTASRGGSLMILLVLFIVFLVRHGHINTKHTLTVVLVILLGLGLMTQLRQGIQSGNFKGQETSDIASQLNIANFFGDAVKELGDYAGAGNTDYSIYGVVSREGKYLLGESYIAILVAPVPRAIWPDKPMGVGRKASQTFLPEYKHDTGVPPSPAGEAFWNFGPVGVFVIFFAWGAFLRWAWVSVKARRYPGIIVIFIVMLFYLRPHTSFFYNWLHATVPLILVLTFYCTKTGIFKNPLKANSKLIKGY